MEISEWRRDHAIWWLLTFVLGGVLAFTLYSFIGTFVLGVFIYYTARPVDDRMREFVGNPRLCSLATLLAFEIPFLGMAAYVVFVSIVELGTFLGAGRAFLLQFGPVELFEAIEDPGRILEGLNTEQTRHIVQAGLDVTGPIATFALHFMIAVGIAFVLLRKDDRVAAWLRTQLGEDAPLLTYFRRVDADLQVVYFSNLRVIVTTALLGVLVYNGYNAVTPSVVRLPVPTLLGVLTGAATMIPIVVGKLVYLPAVAYLSVRAAATDPGLLVYPLGLLVVALLALDLFPVLILRPYLAGRTTRRSLMFFAYVFGGLVFGWYGLFLAPLLLVATIHLAEIAFFDLARGEPIGPVADDRAVDAEDGAERICDPSTGDRRDASEG